MNYMSKIGELKLVKMCFLFLIVLGCVGLVIIDWVVFKVEKDVFFLIELMFFYIVEDILSLIEVIVCLSD